MQKITLKSHTYSTNQIQSRDTSQAKQQAKPAT